jgi:hypothetical protein
MGPTGSAPMPRHQEHWEVHQTAAPESLLAETSGGTPEGVAPTAMLPGTLGRTPACAAPASLLAETSGGTPEGEAPTVMPQGTLGGIPGCVAPELLLAKSPGGMPQAVPSAFVPPVIADDFAGGVTEW